MRYMQKSAHIISSINLSKINTSMWPCSELGRHLPLWWKSFPLRPFSAGDLVLLGSSDPTDGWDEVLAHHCSHPHIIACHLWQPASQCYLLTFIQQPHHRFNLLVRYPYEICTTILISQMKKTDSERLSHLPKDTQQQRGTVRGAKALPPLPSSLPPGTSSRKPDHLFPAKQFWVPETEFINLSSVCFIWTFIIAIIVGWLLL
jgi:hypothetical protein